MSVNVGELKKVDITPLEPSDFAHAKNTIVVFLDENQERLARVNSHSPDGHGMFDYVLCADDGTIHEVHGEIVRAPHLTELELL